MIEEKRNEIINELRSMRTEEQYHELTNYGKTIIFMDEQDIDGSFLTIFVLNYLGSKWFIYLKNGNIEMLQEI